MTSLIEPYPLDNHSQHSPMHHQGLAAMLDVFTLRRISYQVQLTGAKVLEVGAGAGSMAYQMATMAGPEGSVTALDLKPGHVEHDQLHWLQHDLRSAEPIPGGPYDVIHARLVLGHLPERELVLSRLIHAGAPGTLILVEDWHPVRSHATISAPTIEARRLYDRYAQAAGRCFDERGTDSTWARRMHCVFLQHGLADVDTDIHGTYWTGGSSEAKHAIGVAQQLRDEVQSHGLTGQDVDEVLELLANPELVVHSHLLYSTLGYIPPAD